MRIKMRVPGLRGETANQSGSCRRGGRRDAGPHRSWRQGLRIGMVGRDGMRGARVGAHESSGFPVRPMRARCGRLRPTAGYGRALGAGVGPRRRVRRRAKRRGGPPGVDQSLEWSGRLQPLHQRPAPPDGKRLDGGTDRSRLHDGAPHPPTGRDGRISVPPSSGADKRRVRLARESRDRRGAARSREQSPPAAVRAHSRGCSVPTGISVSAGRSGAPRSSQSRMYTCSP